MSTYIGTAGWNVPASIPERFPSDGTHLQRYAQIVNAVEINSTFYRSHRPQTYERWSAQTPKQFRFAVKLPKQITHANRLLESEGLLTRFLAETCYLGEKHGPILMQLPPSLKCDIAQATRFLQDFRAQTDLPIVCKPRHPTWFTREVEEVFTSHQISRVAADPSIVPAAAIPGGALQTSYFRLHGSPRIYYSSYNSGSLSRWVGRVRKCHDLGQDVWCIFDNTALGAALENAVDFGSQLQSRPER